VKTGDIGSGNWSHGRWCDDCNQYHGLIYICPSYSAEVKAKVEASSITLNNNLNDPEWQARQIEKGATPEIINIFKILVGG
jgi:hypothetical protein